MTAQTPTPTILVPADDDMASEPAVTIGEVFASKKLLQPAIAAACGIVAMVFKVTVDTMFVENLTTVLIFGAMIWGGIAAQVGASRRAMEQARVTREAVVSPATAAQAVADARAGVGETTEAVVVPLPTTPAP